VTSVSRTTIKDAGDPDTGGSGQVLKISTNAEAGEAAWTSARETGQVTPAFSNVPA
jgi:hypothetical protein